MKFGITYSIQSLTGEWTRICRDVLDQIERADALGIDYALVSEHHLVEENGYFPSPLTVLAAFAARTERIRLATGILLLPLHHPMAIAEMVAVIDNLSAGRVTLGVGMGYRPEEFAAFNVPIKERGGRMEESLRLLDLLLRERDVHSEGPHFPMEGVTLMPRPVQTPRPPLWTAAKVPNAIRRAARLSDGWYIDPVTAFGIILKRAPIFREAWKAAGKEDAPPDIILRREAFVAETDEEAWEAAREGVLYLYGEYLNWGHLTDDDGRPIQPGAGALDVLRDRFLIGSPETVARRIRECEEALGNTHLVVRMQFPGTDPERVMESIRLLAEEVAPKFRNEGKPSS
ncbi:MAG: LLM class flavin-dependent oxidoreductase [Nitrospinota bacterium]|nr:LLM class flavin-dependent oxidoreductase [Nitrospinota bacterium]